MSATSGMRIWRLISPSFSAASRTGTAQRTISHPAASSAQICRRVASTSRVSVFVIDCTVMGALPPTFTVPSVIGLVWRRLIMASSVVVLLQESKCVDPHQVIVNRVHHQQHQQHQAHLLGPLPLAQRQRAAEDGFDDEEEQVSAVEHRHREEVENGEVDADD